MAWRNCASRVWRPFFVATEVAAQRGHAENSGTGLLFERPVEVLGVAPILHFEVGVCLPHADGESRSSRRTPRPSGSRERTG